MASPELGQRHQNSVKVADTLRAWGYDFIDRHRNITHASAANATGFLQTALSKVP